MKGDSGARTRCLPQVRHSEHVDLSLFALFTVRIISPARPDSLGVSNPAALCSVGRALRGQSSPGRGRTQRSPGRLWLRPACDSFVLPSRGDLGTGSDHIRNLTWGQQVAQHSVKVRHFPRPRGGPCVHRIVVGMDALCAERCQGQPVFSEPRTVASWQCR